jgi:hypothetical protein
MVLAAVARSGKDLPALGLAEPAHDVIRVAAVDDSADEPHHASHSKDGQ